MNKLHALFLWMIFPGVILGWIFAIFSYHFAVFLLEEILPIFKRDMKDYLDGTKKKWNEK